MESIGLLIKNSRIKKNISQEELAGILHVSRQTVSAWEVGKTLPDLIMLKNISKELDISYKKLIRLYNKENSDIGNVNEVLKNDRKIRNVIIIVFVVLLVIVIFITIFMVINNNKFQVYEIYYDKDYIGILVKSKDKNYLSVNGINDLSDDDYIYNIKISVEIDNEEIVIYYGEYKDNLSLIEGNGTNKYNLDKILDDSILVLNLYMIKDDELVDKSYSLSLNKIINSNKWWYLKESGDSYEIDTIDNSDACIVASLIRNLYKYEYGNITKYIDNEKYSYDNGLLYYNVINEDYEIEVAYDFEKKYYVFIANDLSVDKTVVKFVSYSGKGDITCLAGDCDEYLWYVDKLVSEVEKIECN